MFAVFVVVKTSVTSVAWRIADKAWKATVNKAERGFRAQFKAPNVAYVCPGETAHHVSFCWDLKTIQNNI